jgi:hypothetical protein
MTEYTESMERWSDGIVVNPMLHLAGEAPWMP